MNKLIFLLASLILLIGIVNAAPPLPCAFYGEVTLNNDSLPNGYFLTAKINDVVSGECAVVNGKYGYGDDSCVLVYYEDNLKIDFYIGSTKIGEGQFIDKAITNLDFSLDALPDYSGNSANGVCEIGLGECYFNILDCGVEQTNVCATNGVCDSLIGETCSNAPQDCGVCPSTPSSSGGGGSGDSGGSSSGGGGGSGTTFYSTQSNDGGTGDELLSTTNLGETEKQENIGAGITGGVVGFMKSGLGLGLIIGILIILAGIGVVMYKNKSSKNGKK